MSAGELEELFDRFRLRGDVDALGQVFDQTAHELRRVARHLVTDEATAEDLVQSTFVTAIEQSARFDGARELLPWLLGILTRKAKLAQALRARVPDPERLAEREPLDPAFDAELREFVESFDRALQRIPRRYRDVLQRLLAEGKRPEQIAGELGSTPATVRVQLHRGLVHLRRALPPGFALGVLVTSARARGLSAVRGDVLRHASLATKPASVSSSLVLGGWIVSTKLVIAAALALFAGAGFWMFARVEPAQSESSRVAFAPFRPDSTQTPSSSSPTPTPVGPREEIVPDVAALSSQMDELHGALDVQVFWHDGTPAAGLAISCIPLGERQPYQNALSGVSSEDGTVSFERVLQGTASIATDRSGSLKQYDVQVLGGRRAALRIDLHPGIDARGTVLDADGRAVAGATIWLQTSVGAPLGPAWPVARSGIDGSFLARSVIPLSSIFATAERLGSSDAVLLSKDGVPIEGAVTLQLRGESAAIEGSVSSLDGAPIEGALVALRCSNSLGKEREELHWPWISVSTDRNGRFRAAGLHAGLVYAFVAAGEHAPWTETFQLEQDEVRPLAIRLGTGAIVSGTVRDASGSPIAAAEVRSSQRNDPWSQADVWGLITRSDAEGRYRLEGLPAGKSSLEVWWSGTEPAQHLVREIDVAPEESLVADLVFDDGRTIVGRALDPAGNPLASWMVRAVSSPQGPNAFAESVTDAEGRFKLVRLLDRPHCLMLYPTESFRWLARLEGIRPGPSEVVIVGDPADLPSAYLRGSVVDARHQPLTGALVSAHSAGTAASGSTEIRRDDASFRIGPLSRGDCEFVVIVDGRFALQLDVKDLAQREERDLGEIVIPDKGAAEIVLRLPGGQRLEHPLVSLENDRGHASFLATEDGITFRNGRLCPGTYRLFPIASNAAIEIRPIEIRSNETTRLEVALASGTLTSFRFEMRAGDPELGRIHASIRDDAGVVLYEDDPIIGSVETSVQGFNVCLEPGNFRIDVTHPDGRSASAGFEVRASGDVGSPVRLLFSPKR